MKLRNTARTAARVAGLFLAVAGAAAHAADAPAAPPIVANLEAGAQKAAVCGACHGINGNSVTPEWPNLAGQHADYVVEQLHLFKGMVRANPVMQSQAVLLSDQDMADLAAYFHSQTLTGLEADPALYKAGEKLYRGGDVKRGIPACSACHGPSGTGVGPARWPQIRAQHSLYVANQLTAYRARTRYAVVDGQPAPPANAAMMYVIAGRLTDEDIKALAAYVQGLR
jgi:cytochrome c553